MPLLATVFVVTPIVLAAGVVWDFLRGELGGASGDDGLALLLTMLIFVATWSAGLLVAGIAAAWRSAAWTVDAVRMRGTFGVVRHGPSGEWNRAEPSGSLERPA